MSIEQAHYGLNKLKNRYIFFRLIEIALLAIATYLLTRTLANFITAPTIAAIVISVFSGLTVGTLRIIQYRLFNLETNFFTSYLNKNYPDLKESADLLVKEESELTILQIIQKNKTRQQFNILYPEIKLPNRILQSSGILISCGLAYFLMSSFIIHSEQAKKAVKEDKTIEPKLTIIDTTKVSITSLSIKINPPAYTGLNPFTSKNPNLIFAEGSILDWSVSFSNRVSSAKIILSGNDSISLESENNSYRQKKIVSESGFYQIQWQYKNKIYRSDYYKIEAIKDEPPKITVTNPDQFIKLRFDDNLVVGIKSSLTDDYGLLDAQIIATVSKGSGESVKFREEKIRFTTPKQFTGKQLNASVSLNLLKLSLEPGDELYFYIEALDNKLPIPNHQRTETFFIALQDTTAEITAMGDGLGVDLLPEYFRSQRQIIIDTEKLLKDKKKISIKVFNSTSNELGYDQKVLRLRYGQFMGEEGDSGIGQEAAHEALEDSKNEEEVKDVMAKFGHAHDAENEHNLVDQKKDSHDHGRIKDANEKDDPMKAFIHQHDTGEEATFLFQSVKAKLKAALAVMWDAELHLRLYDPVKSLPYQYKALNLLKEISNDNRIYVQRSGFDPPPLKEEKRFTGDLTEVKTQTLHYKEDLRETFPGIRKALLVTEKMLSENTAEVSFESQRTFQLAGQELAGEAIKQPGIYLNGLTLLKSLSGKKLSAVELRKKLLSIRKVLWTVIPQEVVSPSGKQSATHSLDRKFLQSLDNTKNE